MRDHHLTPEINRAIEELEQEVPATAGHPVVMRHILTNLAQSAYNRGASQRLLDLMGAPEVADKLGITRMHVHRLAKQHGIGEQIGRDRLYLPGDLDTFRAVMAVDRRRKSARAQ